MKYDLHVHSNISDGKLKREEIIKMAIKENLQYISFTEHNDFQLVKPNNNIKFINGIEFDVKHDISFHLLSYFPYFNDDINNLIIKYKKNINDTSELLIKNINKIHSIYFTIDDLMNFFDKNFITKRDIIDWLLFNGYAKTVNEAADKFTNKKAISYVPKYSLEFQEVVDVIKGSNGYLILAHPTTLGYDNDKLEKFLYILKNKGLDGIEVVNTSKMSKEYTDYYKELAKKYNFLTSGGSDFHGTSNCSLGIDGNDSDTLIKLLKKY